MLPPETFAQALYQGTLEFAVWVVAPVLTALLIYRFIG